MKNIFIIFGFIFLSTDLFAITVDPATHELKVREVACNDTKNSRYVISVMGNDVVISDCRRTFYTRPDIVEMNRILVQALIDGDKIKIDYYMFASSDFGYYYQIEDAFKIVKNVEEATDLTVAQHSRANMPEDQEPEPMWDTGSSLQASAGLE